MQISSMLEWNIGVLIFHVLTIPILQGYPDDVEFLNKVIPNSWWIEKLFGATPNLTYTQNRGYNSISLWCRLVARLINMYWLAGQSNRLSARYVQKQL